MDGFISGEISGSTYVKVCTHFQTKTAQKPYPTARHIPACIWLFMVHMLSSEIQANPSSAYFFMDGCIPGAISESTYVTFVDEI